MRSTKLLAALAGTALLAACAQEELVKVENAPQQMNEVVGTKLIGTDISLNVNNNPQTRWADGQTTNWDESDVLGLGWIVNKYANTSQTNDDGTPKKPTKHELYANHMFNWDESANEFTSKGNFYEGWYFAYYPWSPMYKVAPKVIEVNPALLACEGEQNPQTLRTSQALRISNRQFVTSANVKEDNSLDMAFNAYHTMNLINVNTTPAEGSAFVKGASRLADYAIESVKIEVGENVFAKYLRLNAANIPAWTNTAKNDLTVEATNEKNFYDNLYENSGDPYSTPILSVVNANGVDTVRSTSIETDVKATGYVASDVTKMGVLVTPFYETLDVKNIVVTVALKGGSFFEIKYVEDAESNSFAEKNNTQLEKLVKVFGDLKDGDIACGLFNSVTSTPVGLNLNLYDAIFNTDSTFNNIYNYEQWLAAVEMAEILHRPAQDFIITGNVEFKNGVIPMPENGCVVTAKCAEYDNRFKQIFTLKQGEYNEWPATLKSSIYVTVAEDAIFNAAHLMNDKTVQIVNKGTINVPAGTAEAHNSIATGAYAVENYGTINVAPYGEIGDVKNHNRIVVEYGAFVYPRDGFTGTIAYNVIDKDVKDPSRIVKLTALETTDTQKRLASVNTLIINEEIQNLDFTKTTIGDGTESDNDPYAPTEGKEGEQSTVDFGDLANVNFEINGGSITSSTEEVVINNVQMNGGEISGLIKIGGDLTIESGVNTVNATNIAGALNITEGVGTITSAASIASVNIEAGNYTVNAQTIDGDVTATGENYFNVKTINGNVEINNTSSNATNIDGATINGDVTLNGDMLLNNVNVNGNLTVLGGKVKMADVNISGDLTNNGSVDVAGEAAAIGAIINNGNLTTYTDITVVSIVVNKNSTVTVADEKTIWYTTPKSEGGYIQKGTTTGEVKYKGADNVLEEFKAAFAEGGDVTLVADVELDEVLTIAEGKEVNLNLNGKTITVKGTSVDPAFYTYKGSTLTITGNGTVEIEDPSVSLIFPGGDVVIENGTFVRNVPAGTPANQVGAFFVGAKVSPWGSQTVTINGGYFDGGYYDANAADVDEILAGTKTLTETTDDIAKRGISTDKNAVRVAIKNNVQLNMNLSYNLLKIYGGTFVGFNPAWGDEGCMLPTTPNYLRPWSYYQGALLDGQTFNANGLVIPTGYEITKGATADGRPTYTVTYNK